MENKKAIVDKIELLESGSLRVGPHTFHLKALISNGYNKEKFLEKYCGPRDVKDGTRGNRAILDYDPILVWNEIEKAIALTLKQESPEAIVEKPKRGRKKKEE